MIRYFYLLLISFILCGFMYGFKAVAQAPPPPNPELLNTPPPVAPSSEGGEGEAPVITADAPKSPEELLLEQGDFSDALELGKDVLVSKYKLRSENVARDPFNSIKAVIRDPASEIVSGVEVLEPKMPLEDFPIDQLKLTGVLWRTATPKASFLDPKGSAHIARKNERIGTNKGYIAAIREGEVIVIEPVIGGETSYQTKIIRINGEDSANEVQRQEGGNQ